jgi:hypothetical protein
VDESRPSPEYFALPPQDREALDSLVETTQEMQNHVDQAIGIMGEPVFFLARLCLGQELQIRTLRRLVADLHERLHDLEDRVS